jgi:transcriptional regulator with XRE-family HTH domain
MFLQRRKEGAVTRVRAERLRRKWSLQELGFHSRIHAPELSKIERRLSVPYPVQAERLAKALGLAVAELLEEVAEHDEASAPARVG